MRRSRRPRPGGACRALRDRGRKVAILSRGYKKKEDPFLTRLVNLLLLDSPVPRAGQFYMLACERGCPAPLRPPEPPASAQG